MTSDADRAALAEIVRETAAYCLSRFDAAASPAVEVKGCRDFVSEVDRAAERIARARLSAVFPGIPIVGEELGGSPCERYFVVDPLDGTTNFLNGLPIWGVSMALMVEGRPVLAAIEAPALDLRMSARAADRPIGNLAFPTSQAALFAVGRNPTWSTLERQATETSLENAGATVVSLGSCAVSLALVAQGKLQGYVERRTRLWDCAAGMLLCETAGCRVRLVPDSNLATWTDISVECGSAFSTLLPVL